MVRRSILGGLLFLSIVAAAFTGTGSSAQAAGIGQPYDWGRFYYYPYVYYQRQIPVYNKAWHNFYPSEHPYYKGAHFILDVF